MRRFPILMVCLLTMLIAIPASLALDEDEEKKELEQAKQALNKLADAVAKGDKDATAKEVQALHKAHDLEPIMHQLKIRRRGGLGFGKKASLNASKDGIEAKVRELARTELSERDLKKDSEDLIRMANVVIAIAKVTELKAPEKKEDKDPADWKAWTKEMESSAMDFIKAVQKQDRSEVREAARQLNNRCSSCHGVFR